jgi:hypothetical protein
MCSKLMGKADNMAELRSPTPTRASGHDAMKR